MKAVQINRYGDPEVLEVNSSAAEPQLKPGQILVGIEAVGINPFDFFILKGLVKDYIKQNFPLTMGGDFSGVVARLGEGVNQYKEGDRVFGTAIILNGSSGALAQRASVTVSSTAPAPKNLDFIQTASLPLVGSSAVQALEDEIKLKKGQKILIHGGAGGIGSFSIQLAKSIGAYVATTVSEKDIEFVKSLGADEVVDYNKEKFEEKLKNYDAVYDTIGGPVMEKSFLVLKKNGVLASMKGQPDQGLAKQYGIISIAINTKTDTTHLDRVRELAESGIVRPEVDKVFAVDQVKEAYLYKQQGHPRGKVIVAIK